mgnify:CR=1 FL=1
MHGAGKVHSTLAIEFREHYILPMAGANALPPVLTVEEVADLMRIDRKTAYAAIAEGDVPGVRRVGRCIRVSRDVLLQWLANGQGGRVEKRRRQ